MIELVLIGGALILFGIACLVGIVVARTVRRWLR